MLLNSAILFLTCLCFINTSHGGNLISKRPSKITSDGTIYRKLGKLEIAGNNLVLRKIKLQKDSIGDINENVPEQELGYELDGHNPFIKLEHRKIDHWDQGGSHLFYVQSISDDKNGNAAKCFEKQISEITKSKYFNDVYEDQLISVNINDYRYSSLHKKPNQESIILDSPANLHESSILNINLSLDQKGEVLCDYISSHEIDSSLKKSYPVEVSILESNSNNNFRGIINDITRSDTIYYEKIISNELKITNNSSHHE